MFCFSKHVGLFKMDAKSRTLNLNFIIIIHLAYSFIYIDQSSVYESDTHLLPINTKPPNFDKDSYLTAVHCMHSEGGIHTAVHRGLTWCHKVDKDLEKDLPKHVTRSRSF